MWERLSGFSFDGFAFGKSYFGCVFVLKFVWERLCRFALTDWFWFEFQNPFLIFFVYIFSLWLNLVF